LLKVFGLPPGGGGRCCLQMENRTPGPRLVTNSFTQFLHFIFNVDFIHAQFKKTRMKQEKRGKEKLQWKEGESTVDGKASNVSNKDSSSFNSEFVFLTYFCC